MLKANFLGMLAVIACGLVIAHPCVSAQTPPNLPQLLQQLQSPDVGARDAAFQQIVAIPHADTRPDVQRALVHLLRLEDNVIEAAPNGVDEGYATYIGEVQEKVYEYAKFTDSEDRATLLALLHSPGNPGNQEDEWLAARAAVTADDLLAIAKEPNAGYRAEAEATLAMMLTAARDGKRQMSDDDRQRAKAAIVGGLKDPNRYVRDQGLQTIARMGDPADVSLLQAVASSDPEPAVRGDAAREAAWLAKQPPIAHP